MALGRTATIEAGKTNIDAIRAILTVEALRTFFSVYSIRQLWRRKSADFFKMRTRRGHDGDKWQVTDAYPKFSRLQVTLMCSKRHTLNDMCLPLAKDLSSRFEFSRKPDLISQAEDNVLIASGGHSHCSGNRSYRRYSSFFKSGHN